jgi:serine/threonine protein kinase
VLLVKHVLDGVSLGHYACKRVPVGDDHEWLEKVLGEVQLLQHLSHQNLVSYRHVWLENAKISTFGPSVPCAFILQQYCNAGDLHNYICGSVQDTTTPQQLKARLRRKSKGEPEPKVDLGGPRKLNFEQIYSFFKDITSGLRHLHVNGYIHRDLKPNNCLLHETSDGLRVLVSDFGEVQAQDTTRLSTGATGTVSYCAPEVLRRDYPGGPFGNFTFKSDIFSLGMILHFLCFAELPYRNADLIHEEKEDLDQLRAEISQWTGFDDERRLRPDLPEKLYTFLKRLLSVNPDRRPTADEVLSGIQAGVNGNEHFRFRRSSSTSPDPRTNSRIHPVDSPDASLVARSVSPRNTVGGSPVALRRSPNYEPNSTVLEAASFANSNGTEKRDSFTSERELMIRPRFSATPPPTQDQIDRAEQTNENRDTRPLQHLLPPPPTRPFLTRLFGIISSRRLPTMPFLPLSLFFVKVVSVFQPCAPLAVNPWVLYPLLLLAGFILRSRSLLAHFVALGVHIVIVSLSMRFHKLCLWQAPGEAMLL